MHSLHTLTALTGRNSSANRTVIIQGFEARRRTLIVLAVGAVPALFITAVLWAIIGQYAVLALPAVEGLVFWLVESRTRNGLQLRTYESLLDKKRSDAGKFYLCGRVIDPELNELGTIVAAAIPATSGGSARRESRPVREFDVDRVFSGAR